MRFYQIDQEAAYKFIISDQIETSYQKALFEEYLKFNMDPRETKLFIDDNDQMINKSLILSQHNHLSKINMSNFEFFNQESFDNSLNIGLLDQS